MNFNKSFSAFISQEKSESCPDACECKSLSGIPAVWVPPPQGRPIVGIIISRDPTTAFIPYYTDAKSESLPIWREQLFATNAIPRWIVHRISQFSERYMQGALSDAELQAFRDTLYHSVYWTHLHKCCTDKRGEASLKFKQKNAFCCANQWLTSEIALASRENIRFIITLGKDVERWFEKSRDTLQLHQSIHTYHLPHPSGANMASWHPKDEQARRALEEDIYNLVREGQ